MTASEFFTKQFYTWEYRGRGWHVSPDPIDIEPPFIPYFRHGYPQEHIDDGKRHTLLSRLFAKSPEKKQLTFSREDTLDYETLIPFPDDPERILSAVQVRVSKEGRGGIEKMKGLLLMLSVTQTPLSFEVIGTASDIIFQFVCDELYVDLLETYLHVYFPSFTILRNDALVYDLFLDCPTAVSDFGLRHEFFRPIQTKGAHDPFITMLGTLDRLEGSELAGVQILFQPVGNAWGESIVRSVTMHDGSSFFYDEPHAPTLAAQKVQSQLFAVNIRTFSQAADMSDAYALCERMNAPLQVCTKGEHNELAVLISDDYPFSTRIMDISNRQSHRMGMLLNIDELLSVVHFPGEMNARKLFNAFRNTKAVPSIAKGKQFVLGDNVHNGITIPVTCDIEHRVRHTHIIGSTGTGKSTLIAQLIRQDIAQGIGIVLFDPHGDLVDEIIAQMPAERLQDVVLVDPSDIEYPIGLNILQAFGDTEKEILSSDLVAIFRRYATSWGDQMSAVLGNAIHALLESADGGSLHDLRRFLIEKDFRQKVLRGVTDPAVLYYWEKEFPLSKTNSIGPILTRLDTFLRPKAIRNMVSQKSGLDFTDLFNGNKIILLKLSQGLIGKENSFLLGSLILSKIHQAILKRQEHMHRTPVFVYLDEFQNFITPSVREMITGIRKYNAGLILSHQGLLDIHREDGELLNSVLANSAVRVVFRVGDADAKRLQDGFAGFDATDLQNLGRGEVVIRIDQPQYDCSLTTVPLPGINAEARSRNYETVLVYSRKMYAASKQEVEKALFGSLAVSEEIRILKEEVPTAKESVSVIKPEPKRVKDIPESSQKVPERDISTHRYLQMLVKNMAEAAGYIVTIEMPISTGSVDVHLQKEHKKIAVEICNTTEAEWEMHNITKCLDAQYDEVISLSGDLKQLEKIKNYCAKNIQDFETKPVFFLTPDALFVHLQGSRIHQDEEDSTKIKGYRVNVTYDGISQEEMDRKRASVANIVAQSLRKRKK